MSIEFPVHMLPRPSLGRAALAGIILCLALGAFSAPAESAPLDELSFDRRAAWEAPVQYSAQVMGLGITGLVAFDLHDSDPSFENFTNALSSPAPRPDDDGPLFNYVLHPLWGSETYLRARTADFTVADSFAFSMGASITWEYLIESWTEHPSSQDLVYTTGIGWMLGELRYRLLRTTGERGRKVLDPLHSALQHIKIESLVPPEDETATPRLRLSWPI